MTDEEFLKYRNFLSYFSVTKSTKSHLGGFSPPVSATPTNALRALVHSRVHELVVRAMRVKCVQHWAKQKLAVLLLSAISYYHACEHITRKNRADSCTHCLHARIKVRELTDLRSKRGRRRRDRVSGRGEISAMMWRSLRFSFFYWLYLNFARQGGDVALDYMPSM